MIVMVASPVALLEVAHLALPHCYIGGDMGLQGTPVLLIEGLLASTDAGLWCTVHQSTI